LELDAEVLFGEAREFGSQDEGAAGIIQIHRWRPCACRPRALRAAAAPKELMKEAIHPLTDGQDISSRTPCLVPQCDGVD
jgi:hypothetical protein